MIQLTLQIRNNYKTLYKYFKHRKIKDNRATLDNTVVNMQNIKRMENFYSNLHSAN